MGVPTVWITLVHHSTFFVYAYVNPSFLQATNYCRVNCIVAPQTCPFVHMLGHIWKKKEYVILVECLPSLLCNVSREKILDIVWQMVTCRNNDFGVIANNFAITQPNKPINIFIPCKSLREGINLVEHHRSK